MNTNQTVSHILSVLKIVSGIVITLAASKSAEVQALAAWFSAHATGPDAAAFLTLAVGFYASHCKHSDLGQPSSSVASKTGVVLLFATLSAAGLLSFGCATAPTNIYKTVGTTDTTVTAAVKAWDIYVSQNTVPVAQQQAVKAAFLKVQAAEVLVLDADAAYAAYTGTNAPAGVVAQSTAAAANASAALTDLLNLLAQFGIKV